MGKISYLIILKSAGYLCRSLSIDLGLVLAATVTTALCLNQLQNGINSLLTPGFVRAVVYPEVLKAGSIPRSFEQIFRCCDSLAVLRELPAEPTAWKKALRACGRSLISD